MNFDLSWKIRDISGLKFILCHDDIRMKTEEIQPQISQMDAD